MIILKFGGTSVSTKKNILTICHIAKKELHRQPVIVVSALSKVTDILLSVVEKNAKEKRESLQLIKKIHTTLANQLFGKHENEIVERYIDECLQGIAMLLKKINLDNKKIDELASYGEKMSSFIIVQKLLSEKITAEQIIATELIVTDNHFRSAEFLPTMTKRQTKKILWPRIKKGIIPVVTGFIGATKNGEITTLGRGGSDYSASILGYCLNADEIQIWTDVNGIYSTDPHSVKNARVLPVVSYREASELASFGAKVLHPRTIRPAVKAGIAVRVLNTFEPEKAGTVIIQKAEVTAIVKAITGKKKVPLITICSTHMLFQKGFLVKIFEVFSKYNISVDLVSVSEVSVSVTLDTNENLHLAVEELSKFTTVTTTEQNGIVSLIGENIVETPKLMEQIFSLLNKESIPVKMISYGATNINISFVIPSEKIDGAVRILHKRFIEMRSVKREPTSASLRGSGYNSSYL